MTGPHSPPRLITSRMLSTYPSTFSLNFSPATMSVPLPGFLRPVSCQTPLTRKGLYCSCQPPYRLRSSSTAFIVPHRFFLTAGRIRQPSSLLLHPHAVGGSQVRTPDGFLWKAAESNRPCRYASRLSPFSFPSIIIRLILCFG